jgi:hypothetical protein
MVNPLYKTSCLAYGEPKGCAAKVGRCDQVAIRGIRGRRGTEYTSSCSSCFPFGLDPISSLAVQNCQLSGQWAVTVWSIHMGVYNDMRTVRSLVPFQNTLNNNCLPTSVPVDPANTLVTLPAHRMDLEDAPEGLRGLAPPSVPVRQRVRALFRAETA